MKKVIFIISILVSGLLANNLWYKQNNQESWTKRYDRSNMSKKVSKQTYKNNKSFSKQIDTKKVPKKKDFRNILSKDIKKRKKNSKALKRLEEMQLCEAKAKTKEERKKCWTTKSQREFNKRMANRKTNYKELYDKQLKNHSNNYADEAAKYIEQSKKARYNPFGG
jgi:hypothetical protein